MRARWTWFAFTLGLLGVKARAEEPIAVPADVLRAWEALPPRTCGPVSRPRAPPPLQRWRLANGLDVVLAPDPRDARVRVSLTWDVGDGDGPPGQLQAAHAAEHLTFRAAPGLPPLGPALADIALAPSGGTTYSDRTVYEGEVAPEHLDRLLWLERERMAHAVDYIRADGLARERPILRHEAALTTGRWAFLRGLSLRASLPEGHRSHASWASFEAVPALDDAVVRSLVRDRYAPGNARLVVVGRFDPAAVRSRIERDFGSIPPRPVPPRPRDDGALTFTASHRVARTIHPAAVVVAWPVSAVDGCHDATLRVLTATLRRTFTATLGAPDPESPRWSIEAARQGGRSLLVFESRVAQGHTHADTLRAMDDAMDAGAGALESLGPVDGALTEALDESLRESSRDLAVRTAWIAQVPREDDPGGFRCARAAVRDADPVALRDLLRRLRANPRLVVDFHADPSVLGLQLDGEAP